MIMDFSFTGVLYRLWNESGFMGLFADPRYFVMILIACVLLYFGIVKKYEPLLLVPIAFGVLLANIPMAGLMDDGGLFYYL